jgi:hypothetical protein
VTKLLNILWAIIRLIELVITRYKEHKIKKEYEKAADNPGDVFVDEFGVQRETKSDASETKSE